jgi:CRP-like cAMP-binding protein
VLFNSDGVSYDFFTIVSGSVQILNDTDGFDEVTPEHGPGRFLGELNVLIGQRVWHGDALRSAVGEGSAAIRSFHDHLAFNH